MTFKGMQLCVNNNSAQAELSNASLHLSKAVLSVAWSFGIQLVVFVCSGISVVFLDKLEMSRCHSTLFLSSPSLSHRRSYP